jgi:two-component system response regulator GlrR
VKRILLVDDNADLLLMLKARLAAEGYAVETAPDGRSALARLADFQPHLVISDLRMPGADGLELLDEIHRRHPGLVRAAQGGTLLFDEIGDMPLPLQVKLVRVLQERQVRPVGSVDSFPVDVRVVSATHRDLKAAIKEGRLREDLYYRLNVVELNLPPLREHPEDIPLLANHHLRQLAARRGTPPRVYAPDAMELLAAARWPGNVRQLFNVVEQNDAVSRSPVIGVRVVQRALGEPVALRTFAEARDEFVRSYLVQLLQLTGDNIARSARLAGRNRSEFYKLLARHGLGPKRSRIEPVA